jgi:hypothetical protein
MSHELLAARQPGGNLTRQKAPTPLGQVPVLVLRSGEVLTGSATMACIRQMAVAMPESHDAPPANLRECAVMQALFWKSCVQGRLPAWSCTDTC